MPITVRVSLWCVATVEVFADVLCPFTHVGLHTLIDRRTQRVVGSPHFFTGDGGHFIVAWKEGGAAFVDRVFA